MLKRGYDFFFQFQRLAEQWLIDRDSEYHLILDMPAKQARSPSNGLLTGIIFFAFFSWTEASAKRREVWFKREAARSASQARGGDQEKINCWRLIS